MKRIDTILFALTEGELKILGLEDDPRLEDGKIEIFFKFFDGIAVECDESGNVPDNPIILSYAPLKVVHLFREYEKHIAKWNQVRVGEIEPFHVAQYFNRATRLSNLLHGDTDNGIQF